MAAASSLGEARAGHSAVVVDGRIFVMGGHTGVAARRALEVFQPGDGSESPGEWQELPPMLSRRAYLSAAVVDGKIYAFGGSQDGRSLNSFEVFDPETSTWSPWFCNNPSLVRRTMHGCAAYPGDKPGQWQFFIVGGFDGLRDLRSAERFDVVTQCWERTFHMEHPRSYLALAVTRLGLFAIGGQDRNRAQRFSDDDDEDRGGPEGAVSALTVVEFFDFHTEHWNECSPLQVPRQGLAAATLTKGDEEDAEEQVYVCGGSDGEKALASVAILDVKSGEWSEGPPMNVPRLGHAVVALGGKLYAIGGHDGIAPLDTFECLDPSEGKWSAPVKMGEAPPQAIADA